METIFITGHRNPDLDSVAAALSYAALKDQVESGIRHVAAALGPLNAQSKAVLKSLGLEDPVFLKDVFCRVSSVYRRPTLVLAPDDPVYELVNMYAQNNPSVVPIMDGDVFMGLLSIDGINSYFLRENREGRPVYDILLSNIPRTIKGFFLRRGCATSVHAPVMVGAMDYKVFLKRLKACQEKPVLVVGNRTDHIKAAMEEDLPGLILTGMDEDSLEAIDLTGYKGFIYVSYEDTAETIRLFRLAVSVKTLLTGEEASLKVMDDMLFETAKGMLADSALRGLPVFRHEDGSFLGFVTRRCFLNMPRQRVILVDHNEAAQSVPGLEDAEIVEIIDHHRLDAPKTHQPIRITAAPVGSTCTMIYQEWQRHGIKPDEAIAKLMLAGISSDTLMLRSPTTTVVDRRAVDELVRQLSLDYDDFCKDLFSHGSSLSRQDPSSVVSADFKTYTECSVRFGIGQVEVTTFSDVPSVKEDYIKALEAVSKRDGLEWAMLLVTNVMSEDSLLICTPYKKSYKLLYEEKEAGLYHLPGVLSRKKQLLPEIIRVLG